MEVLSWTKSAVIQCVNAVKGVCVVFPRNIVKESREDVFVLDPLDRSLDFEMRFARFRNCLQREGDTVVGGER